MRYFALLFLLCMKADFSLSQQINFTLKGRINKDSKAEKLILQGAHLDVSLPISSNKEFSYEGTLPEAEEILIKTDKSYAWNIWIADGDIDIKLQEWELDTPDPSGKKLLKITAIHGPAETEKLQWISDQRNEINSRFPNLTGGQYKDTMAKYFDPLLEQYIAEHPNAKFSAHVAEFASSRANQAKLLTLINRELTTEETQRLKNAIEREKMTKVGATVENFDIESLDGELFSLSKLSSKYTLLDFWSSWCGPCRSKHPALIKIYNEFQSKGFEIVAISLDDSKTAWQKAVQHDKIPWIHISELKGWDGSLAKRFFIDDIPFNFLLDEHKRIVARNLTPYFLAEKLKELLDK